MSTTSTEYGENIMPNWIKIARLLIGGTMNDVIEFALKSGQEASDILYSIRLQLKIATVLPVLLLITGVAIGANASTVHGENVGHGFILASCVIATSMMGLLIVRGTFYGGVLMAVGRATKNSFALSLLPDTETAKGIAQKCAGVMAWVTGVCLYAQVVPVWRAVGLSLIVATAMMGLAYLIVSGKFASKTGWYALLGLTVFAIVVPTLRLASPRFAVALDEVQTNWLGSVGDTDAEKILIKRFTDEKAAINLKAVTECHGQYCSDADRARVNELDTKLEQLRTGHYWENAGIVHPAASVTTDAPQGDAQPVSPATSASAKVATPPAAPATARPAPPPTGKAMPATTSDPFAPLDNL